MSSELISVRYSFTITLKPSLYNVPASVQYDKTYDELYKHLCQNFNVKLTLVAELTRNYNIHFHGTIVFIMINVHKYNVMKRFVDSFRKSKIFGFVNIKQIEDEPGWIDYISKGFHDFTRDTNRRPILQDDFDYWKPDIYALYGTEW